MTAGSPDKTRKLLRAISVCSLPLNHGFAAHLNFACCRLAWHVHVRRRRYPCGRNYPNTQPLCVVEVQ